MRFSNCAIHWITTQFVVDTIPSFLTVNPWKKYRVLLFFRGSFIFMFTTLAKNRRLSSLTKPLEIVLVKVAYHILPALVYFFPNYAKNYLVFENLKKEIKSKNIYAKLVPIELDLEMTMVGKLRLMQCCSYLWKATLTVNHWEIYIDGKHPTSKNNKRMHNLPKHSNKNILTSLNKFRTKICPISFEHQWHASAL